MTILLIAFTLRGFALGHAFMQQEIHRGLVQRFLRLPANAAKISRVHASSKHWGLANVARHSSQIAGLRLRVRTDADWASLADLWVASWREAMPDIDFEQRRRWFLDHLRGLEADGAITICAFDGLDRLLGFVTVDPARAYLDQFAVAPGAKGTGVGKAPSDRGTQAIAKRSRSRCQLRQCPRASVLQSRRICQDRGRREPALRVKNTAAALAGRRLSSGARPCAAPPPMERSFDTPCTTCSRQPKT